MTDLILAAVSLVGAWAYAVVAVAVWRALDKDSEATMVAAIGTVWVLGLGIPAVLTALTLTLRWLPKTQGLLGVAAIVTVFAAGIVTGCVFTAGGERQIAAALWPVAGLCWLVARSAVVTARVAATVATVAVAPARLVGRKRIAAAGRDQRIATLEKELEIGD